MFDSIKLIAVENWFYMHSFHLSPKDAAALGLHRTTQTFFIE